MPLKLFLWTIMLICLPFCLCLGGDLDWTVKAISPMYSDNAAVSVIITNNSAESKMIYLGYEQLGVFSFDVFDQGGRLIATAAKYEPGGCHTMRKKPEYTLAPKGKYEIIASLSYWDVHLAPGEYRIKFKIETSLLTKDENNPIIFHCTPIPMQPFSIPISILPGKAKDILGDKFEYVQPHPPPNGAMD